LATHGQYLRTGLLAIAVGLVLALGRTLSVCFEGRLPQVPGEDVVALVLGDARLEISRTLEDKADEYFHGGVRNVNCTIQSEAEEHAHEGPSHGDADHDHDAAHAAGTKAGGDLWQWIDGRVHEQTHKHLTGDQTVELLPWLWAATRLSPKNRRAYENGAYVLAYMLEKPDEAVRLLEEGIRKNPESPELILSLGEMLLNRLHDAVRAEPFFVLARQKCMSVPKDKTRAGELVQVRLRSLFYLGYIAKQRGDRDRIQRCLEEAEAPGPDDVVVKNLHDFLENPGVGR